MIQFFRKAFMLILFSTLCWQAAAQWQFTPFHKDYFDKNLFGQFGVVCLLDFSPTQVHHHMILDEVGDPHFFKHGFTPITGLMMQREVRFNLLTYKDKGSLSFNPSAFLGLTGYLSGSETMPDLNDFNQNYVLDWGFGCLRVPLLLQWNQGFMSTYNNIDKFGFHIGFGRQFNWSPLIILNPVDYLRIARQSIMEDHPWYWNNLIRMGVQWESPTFGSVCVDLHLAFGKPSMWKDGQFSKMNQYTLVIAYPFIQKKEWRKYGTI